MDYVRIGLCYLSALEFAAASGEQVKTWLLLQKYCAIRENSGKIADCYDWPSSAWMTLVGVDMEVVKAPCGLWSWSRKSLLVSGYPLEDEALLNLRRKAGREAVRRRGGSWSPESTRNGSSDRSPITNAYTDRSTEREKEEPPISPFQGDHNQAEGQASFLNAKNESRSKAGKKKGRGLLPEEAAEPLRGRMLRLNGLFRRRASTVWNTVEVDAFVGMGLDRLSDADWEVDVSALERYYAMPLEVKRDFRRRSLATLLNNWSDDVVKCGARVAEEKKRMDPDGLGEAV